MSISLAQANGLAEGYTQAWNTGDPRKVADFYSETGGISINRGSRWSGREGVATMAAGFYADVPDLALVCDGVRVMGDHMIYLWTFTGTHAGSGKKLCISGAEEWDLDAGLKVQDSRGWFDPAEWARQTA